MSVTNKKNKNPSKAVTFDVGNQGDLFEMVSSLDTDTNKYGNLLDFWESLPLTIHPSEAFLPEDTPASELTKTTKYKPSARQKVLFKRLGISINEELTIRIRPALIDIKEVIKDPITQEKTTIIKTVHAFPSVREDRVEKTLIKFASDGNLVLKNKGNSKDISAGVKFTAKKVREETYRLGVSMQHEDIRQAIEILHRSNIKIESDVEGTGRMIMSGYRIPLQMMLDQNDFKAKRTNGEEIHNYCEFHPLITKAINNFEYRLENYDTGQKLLNYYARYMNKQMRMHFTNATKNGDPFVISLIDSMAENGKVVSDFKADSRRFRLAIKELVNKGVLRKFDSKFDQILLKNKHDRRRTSDIHFLLHPSDGFVEDIIKMHQHNSMRRAKIEEMDESYEKARKNGLSIEQRDVMRQAMAIGISENKAREVIKKYPLETISDWIKEVHHNIELGKTTLSQAPGFVISALRLDWELPTYYSGITRPNAENLDETTKEVPISPELENVKSWKNYPNFTQQQRAFIEIRGSALSISDWKNLYKNGFVAPSLREQLTDFINTEYSQID